MFEEVRRLITEADLYDDDEFRAMVYTMFFAIDWGHDSDDVDATAAILSNELGVSRPTVLRWLGGITAPHVVMREPVRRCALSRIDKLVKEH